MSMQARAAQFAPFAALSGFGESVHETERVTDQDVLLDEYKIAEINDKLMFLYTCKAEHPQATITYFVKDRSKEGGSYETVTGTVKNIDAVFCYVIMDDDTMITIKDIRDIEL